MKIIVRISDKSGSRIERHVLGKTPLTIGRAWDNDIILQDQFVDADHLSVQLVATDDDGTRIEISDLQSTNGTLLASKRLVGEDNLYRSGDSIKVGDTRLEILDASVAVEKTAIRSFWFFMRERFHSLPSLLSLTLLTILVAILDEQFLSADPSKLSNLMLTISFTLLFLFVWSLVFGFISKLIRGESNIRTHWALACIGTTVLTLLNSVLLVVLFNLQDVELGKALTTLTMCSVSAVLLFALFTYTSNLSARAKMLSSMLIMAGVVVSVYSAQLFKEPHQRWSNLSQIETANMPPVFLLRSAVDTEHYMQKTSQLFVEIDRSLDE